MEMRIYNPGSTLSFVLAAFMIANLAACTPQETPDPQSDPLRILDEVEKANDRSEKLKVENTLQAIKTHSEKRFTRLQAATISLNKAIQTFINHRSLENLTNAKEAWRLAHNEYLGTRALRTLCSSLGISHEALDRNEVIPDKPIQHSNKVKVDQYPILPGYLDSVKGYPFSGLIHSDIELNEATLHSEHQLSDTAYVAIGFHAIEFMLSGESNDLQDRLGDYHTKKDERENNAVKRRALYLGLLGKMLLDDISALVDAWITPSAFYISQLNLVSSPRLTSALSRLVDVELEAIRQIRAALKDQPSTKAHDNESSLLIREELAKALKQATKPPEQNEAAVNTEPSTDNTGSSTDNTGSSNDTTESSTGLNAAKSQTQPLRQQNPDDKN